MKYANIPVLVKSGIRMLCSFFENTLRNNVIIVVSLKKQICFHINTCNYAFHTFIVLIVWPNSESMRRIKRILRNTLTLSAPDNGYPQFRDTQYLLS